MKNLKYLFAALMLIGIQPAFAQSEEYAEMTFEETTHNFGLFDIEHGDQTCWFVFKNTGNKPLVIESATASCGCTEPTYPKTAVLPGMKDSIMVSYKGSTRRPGVFRKSISILSNAKINSAYLYITGEMVEKLVEERVVKEEK